MTIIGWIPDIWLILLNPMRTTCRLVKRNILWFIEPIREGVRKNSLICKFSMLHFESLIMIDLTNEHFMIWTNQEFVLEGYLVQGGINQSGQIHGTWNNSFHSYFTLTSAKTYFLSFLLCSLSNSLFFSLYFLCSSASFILISNSDGFMTSDPRGVTLPLTCPVMPLHAPVRNNIIDILIKNQARVCIQ